MSAVQAEPGPARPVVDVRRLLAKWWPVAVGAALLVGVVVYRQATDTPAVAPAEPVVVERTPTTTTPTPKLDPMANFTKAPSPLTQGLVGGAYADKAELARRLNELLGQGLNDCQVFIGSDGVAWSLSAVWSAAHPGPVFASCPFPPTAVAK